MSGLAQQAIAHEATAEVGAFLTFLAEKTRKSLPFILKSILSRQLFYIRRTVMVLPRFEPGFVHVNKSKIQ